MHGWGRRVDFMHAPRLTNHLKKIGKASHSHLSIVKLLSPRSQKVVIGLMMPFGTYINQSVCVIKINYWWPSVPEAS
jgi:hypothetical protein